ncbi:MAG: hypothetical protein OEM89_08625, partial [Nitrosopumilus sp.]|nr:hypothetical protein [Nitrosopumilus sp.]
MINNKINLAFALFIISTTMVIGSTIDAFATHEGTQGTTGGGDLEACLNNLGSSPCDTADEWASQNISSKVSYTLNESIPVRVDITNLETDADYHELIVEWDLTKKQGSNVNHTFDYITSFDRNDNPHPCLVLDPIPRCDTWDFDTAPIPAPGVNTNIGTVGGLMQPITSFNAITDPNEKLFYMFAEGGTVDILHVSYVSEGVPSEVSSTQLSVIFTTTNSHVVAAFGAHLASSNDWVNTASDVQGQPYQVSCIEVNGGGCNAHININASDINPLPAPTVTLIKALQDGAADLDSFGLSIGGEAVNSGDTITFEAGETPALDEVGLEGYEFVSVGGDDKCPIESLPGNVAALVDGDAITCTITNTLSECPTGEIHVGDECVPIVCDEGFELVGNECVPIVCDEGFELVGNECVPIVCDEGFELVGNECVPIVCDEG